MTDRYENIRRALEMGSTPGPFSVVRSYSPGNQELILRLTCNDEYGITENYCTVRNSLGDTWKTEADAAFIAACDPDTIRALLAERDALRAERDELAEQLRLATIAEALAEAEANDAVIAAAPEPSPASKKRISQPEKNMERQVQSQKIYYAFLVKRPKDKQAWPTIYENPDLAAGAFGRVSEVVPVALSMDVSSKKEGQA